MLDIYNFGCIGLLVRIGKLTLKPQLMEAILALTPTSCVNYKALVEVFPVE